MIRIRTRLAVVARAGPPPTFQVETDRPSFDVSVAIDPALLQGSLASRRILPGASPGVPNYFSSGPLAVTGSTTSTRRPVPGARITDYRLDPAAWAALQAFPHLYFQAATAAPVETDAGLSPLRIAVPPPAFPPTPRRGLSGSLPRLQVRGNRVEVSAGTTQILRGLNRSGLQYTDWPGRDPSGSIRSTPLATSGITRAEIQEIRSRWGANILRLPLNQEWALSRSDYLRDLDRIIEWAAAEGMYTLLNLHAFDTRREFGPGNHVPPLPEENSVRFWILLASRYRREPAVLYDLFNEPHVPLAGDTSYVFQPPATPTGWIHLWHDWIRRLAAAIHRVHPDALLFVSGWDWGHDLSSFPVPISGGTFLRNAVYSTHIYQDSARAGHTDFERLFGFPRLRVDHPIFVGEWGGDTTATSVTNHYASSPLPAGWASTILTWGRELEDYMRERHRSVGGTWQGLAGWTAWSWGDWPHVVERARTGTRPYTIAAGVHSPTPFGALVQAALLRPP